jgi:hypothetical protein
VASTVDPSNEKASVTNRHQHPSDADILLPHLFVHPPLKIITALGPAQTASFSALPTGQFSRFKLKDYVPLALNVFHSCNFLVQETMRFTMKRGQWPETHVDHAWRYVTLFGTAIIVSCNRSNRTMNSKQMVLEASHKSVIMSLAAVSEHSGLHSYV